MCSVEKRDLEERLRDWAIRRGYGIAWGEATLVGEMQDIIGQRLARGEIDRQLFAKEMAGMLEPLAEQTGTVICVSVPRPAHILTFETAQEPFTTVVPPIFVELESTRDSVQRDIEALLEPVHVAPLWRAPLKWLAVRLGLAKYGRNSLTYTSESGSHHQLAAVLVDVDLEPWPGMQDLETMLPQCATCEACRNACPTGAIGPNRHLVRGERCVTFPNENVGDWPEWVTARTHSALIGCMRCITVCPANRGKLQWEDFGKAFTRAETEAILNGRCQGHEAAWQAAADRFLARGFGPWLDVLSRNLKAVMAHHSR